MFSTIGYAICIPFAALLRLFYNLTGSYGVSLILFTLVIKLILLPFQMKSKKSMVRMSRMSGKMQEIQKKYANNQLKIGDAEVLPGRGLQSYERLPVELSAPAHSDGPVLYHPGAHCLLHELRRQGRRSGGSECGQKSD